MSSKWKFDYLTVNLNSQLRYVPPNVRGDDSSATYNPPAQGPIPGLPPGYISSKSQAAAKAKNNTRQNPSTANNEDSDDRKKASAIKKKLKDIKVLKEKAEKGEKLDKNQLNKIASEIDLNKELAALKLF